MDFFGENDHILHNIYTYDTMIDDVCHGVSHMARRILKQKEHISMSNRVLITQAHVLTMTQQTPVDHDILIQDGKIVQMGPQLRAEDAQVIDLQGAYVLPGLFNCHVHTCSSASNDTSTDKPTTHAPPRLANTPRDRLRKLAGSAWAVPAGRISGIN